ncbi:MAG: aspartate aminotransferase family protein [Clostridia bacterium]|nr:aspartate aminotransferase family protein [Clostridia bacterium]
MNFEQIKEMNNASAMPTYGRYDLGIASGKGAVAKDFDGREYIDFTSGIGVNCLGYADDGWADAVAAQAHKLSHISNLYYTDATASFTDKLTKATGFSKVFLGNSGAEANECAIKVARKYSFDKYGEGRYEIITLLSSFHGRTMSTLTATGQDALHPDCFAPYNGGFVYCEKDIEQIKAAISDKTCAVMMEMIQGEGGVIPLDKDFVNEVCALAKEKDLLVIIDEVQTGIGRTGKLLAHENYGIKPDVVTLAKGLGGGLPIGACLCTEALGGVMSAGTHGSTFGGNPIVCAGASYVLDKVNNEAFFENVRANGEYIREKVSSFKNVKSIRGMGMMIGIEVEGKTGADVVKKGIANGVICLTAKTLVRLLPPLNITREEIDLGLERLKEAIEE